MIATLDAARVPELLERLRAWYPAAPLKADEAFFRWRFWEHPLGSARDRYFLAILDGRIVGQWAALPDRLLCDGAWRDVVWMIDLFVDPAYRDRPVAAELFRAAMRAARERTPILATGAHEGLTPFYRTLRWRTLSVVDTFYSVLRPSRLLEVAGRRIPRWMPIADLVVPMLQKLDTRGAHVEPLRSTAELAPIVDRLLPELGRTGWRGPDLLRWKFEDRPHGQHFGHVVPGRGYLLSRMKRRKRSTWVEVADFVAGLDDEPTFHALLDAARAEAATRGADFVRLRCSRSEHTRALIAPRWVRYSRTAVDDVHLYGNERDLDELCAGPWHHTALASDTVDSGGDEVG